MLTGNAAPSFDSSPVLFVPSWFTELILDMIPQISVSKTAEIAKDAVTKKLEKVKDSAIKSIEKKVENQIIN